jgi:hypothetical protein
VPDTLRQVKLVGRSTEIKFVEIFYKISFLESHYFFSENAGSKYLGFFYVIDEVN